MTNSPRVLVKRPRFFTSPRHDETTRLAQRYGTAVIDPEGYTGTVRRKTQRMPPSPEPGMVLVQLDRPDDHRWVRWYREDELKEMQ